MNVPNAFEFPLRGASGIFPILSGEKWGMPLWMKMLLPSMLQLLFTDIPHIFTCIQHPRAVCNIVSAELVSSTIWPAYKLAQAQFLQIWTWGSLFPGFRKGNYTLHGCSKSPCAEPKEWGSIPTRGSPKDVGASASGLVCFKSSPVASKHVNLAQSSVSPLGEAAQGTAVKQMKCCRVTFLLVADSRYAKVPLNLCPQHWASRPEGVRTVEMCPCCCGP